MSFAGERLELPIEPDGPLVSQADGSAVAGRFAMTRFHAMDHSLSDGIAVGLGGTRRENSTIKQFPIPYCRMPSEPSTA